MKVVRTQRTRRIREAAPKTILVGEQRRGLKAEELESRRKTVIVRYLFLIRSGR